MAHIWQIDTKSSSRTMAYAEQEIYQDIKKDTSYRTPSMQTDRSSLQKRLQEDSKEDKFPHISTTCKP